MKGSLRPGTKRVSYIEDAVIDSVLSLLTHAKRTNKSALIREATEALVRNHDESGDLRSLGTRLVASLPDSPAERAKAEISPELQLEVASFFESLKR